MRKTGSKSNRDTRLMTVLITHYISAGIYSENAGFEAMRAFLLLKSTTIFVGFHLKYIYSQFLK